MKDSLKIYGSNRCDCGRWTNRLTDYKKKELKYKRNRTKLGELITVTEKQKEK